MWSFRLISESLNPTNLPKQLSDPMILIAFLIQAGKTNTGIQYIEVRYDQVLLYLYLGKESPTRLASIYPQIACVQY